MPDPIKPTAADYAVAERANKMWGAAINGPHVAVLAAMLAREQGRQEGCEQAAVYLESVSTKRSDQMKISAIRALKEQPPC